jgi:Exostosin family
MLVHVAALTENFEAALLLHARAASTRYVLTPNADAADLIILVGNFAREPTLLLDHPALRAHPERCAVYTEDDWYLPLIPGLYSSARRGLSSELGRVRSYSYVTATGSYGHQVFEAIPSPPQKKWLFSFQGGSTSILRKRLFKTSFTRSDVFIENTSSNYKHWDTEQQQRDERQRRYVETLKASHFVLCPRGAGSGSIRLFECMRAGIAPVLISDDYVLPRGVDWDTFLVRVSERRLASLPQILGPLESKSAERGAAARLAWLAHFAPDREFEAVVLGCAAAVRSATPLEPAFRAAIPAMLAKQAVKSEVRSLARGAVLRAFQALGLPLPFGIQAAPRR